MTNSNLQLNCSASSTRVRDDVNKRLDFWWEWHFAEIETELEQRNKKRKKILMLAKTFGLTLAGCFCACLVALGVSIATPTTNTYNSPDGKYAVETIYPSLLSCAVGPGTVKVVLIDQHTNYHITIRKKNAAALVASDESPIEIIWKSDSKSFAYLYHNDPGGVSGCVYDLKKPFQDRYLSTWVKQEIAARVRRGVANDAERGIFIP